MMQVPLARPQQAPALTPTYNAVKIDVHNPQINAPAMNQPMPTQGFAPVYEVPRASVYEVPQKSVYGPNQNFNSPPIAEKQPSVPVPAPVLATPEAIQIPQTQAEKVAQVAPQMSPIAAIAPVEIVKPAVKENKVEEAKVEKNVEQPSAAPKTIEVKKPEVMMPKVDINAFIAKLTGANYEEQANAMEAIADMAQNNPQQATELLDTRVIDSLMGIVNADSSKLEGPSAKQLEIREKIIAKKPVTEAESQEANVITPMEQAERNKQYAMYTIAILQKLFASEIQKTTNAAVPLTELPGSANIVEQVKSNQNPMVRASAIDSLSYIQAPEYKQELETIFKVAQNDKDPVVKETATKALNKLNTIQ